jgi:hypothetical protein
MAQIVMSETEVQTQMLFRVFWAFPYFVIAAKFEVVASQDMKQGLSHF